MNDFSWHLVCLWRSQSYIIEAFVYRLHRGLAGRNVERAPAIRWCEGAEAQSPSMDDGLKIARMMRWPAFFFLLTTTTRLQS
jgi:hypothetical protein